MNKEEIDIFLKNDKDVENILSAFVNDDKQFPAFFRAINEIYKNKFVAFSPWSFLFGFSYFTYRRLYLPALILFIIGFALPFILNPEHFSLFSLFISVAVGTSFFPLYFSRFFKIVKNAGYPNTPVTEIVKMVKNRGGADKAGVIILVISIVIAMLNMNTIK